MNELLLYPRLDRVILNFLGITTVLIFPSSLLYRIRCRKVCGRKSGVSEEEAWLSSCSPLSKLCSYHLPLTT